MNNHQLTTLWLGSLRYYIGRRTAGVSDFTNLLIQEWSNLPPETQNFIERDLEEVLIAMILYVMLLNDTGVYL